MNIQVRYPAIPNMRKSKMKKGYTPCGSQKWSDSDKRKGNKIQGKKGVAAGKISR